MLDQDTLARINELQKQIARVSDRFRIQLNKMNNSVRELTTEISRESVICRRLCKETPRYIELVAKLEESLNTVEQYLVIAKLMG
jgi:hypothetical protein